MTETRNWGSNNAIVLIGALMGVYLAVLIAFGYFGQQRLQEALHEQQQLNIEKQATAVAYFLADQQETLVELSENPQLQDFLANRDLQMTMSNGLQANLKAVAREFDQVLELKRAHGRPIFNNVALIESNGRTLIEAGDKRTADVPRTDPVRKDGRIGRMHKSSSGAVLTFTAPVVSKGEPVGYVAADIDAASMLQPFLADRGGFRHRNRTALVGPHDEVIVAGDQGDWSQWRIEAQKKAVPLLASKVSNTELSLVQFPDTASNQGFLTSPLLLTALSFIALPMLGSMIYLLKLNNHNLVLRTRFQSTTQQRAILRKQNEQLQREVEKRVDTEQKLVHQANYDQLTGLPNRNLAMDRLAQAIKFAKRDNANVLAFFLDLDRFKQVNDSLGHAAGDALLREAAQRLKAQVRESDTVSRLGGDEFLVICPEMPEKTDGENCARQMLKAMSAPFYIEDHEFFVGASIGVAAYPQAGSEPQRLLKNADIAMYAAKEKGRNQYCHYAPSMDAMALRSVRLEHNLRHALQKEEFYLDYQPIVDLTSGRTVAVESLLRWTNEELGRVSPEEFIPIAEETGLIHEIGEWTLKEACSTVSAMHPDRDFRVTVNLSSKQFSRPNRLLDSILFALRQSGLLPSQLELEITESILIDDREEIAELVTQLDRIGVRLSIDDFGTGYSALNYLQRFPFDVLKIDRSFIRQVPSNEASASLIRAIIAMAHALELEVVAEGIETREQAGFLLIYHCAFGQGYLYSEPMAAHQLQHHLNEEQAMSA
jgi:diguanylate cyclase (GGDEF)-like protein